MPGLTEALWSDIGGTPAALDALTRTGPPVVLPSVFDVTGLAASAVGVAALAAAELVATRNGTALPPVTVDTRQACAAFLCEALFQPVEWERPPIWDPIAGDYEAADGWVKLHTNYAAHRAAALRALELGDADRAEVTAAVAGRPAAEIEAAVVAQGGCAAAMRTAEAWAAHPHGAAVAGTRPVTVTASSPAAASPLEPADRPFAGVRVLDLTRVIAGPVCTRFLAAHGARVLRVDPPGFEEVPALLPETTAGKHCTALDLRDEAGRATFERLVTEADVIVHGLRPGALAGLGLGPEALRRRNPALVIAALDAYGWTGPWAGRRGFDSLVQMSCGIAAAPTGGASPRPLPTQALDHGTGMLLAAAVARALTERQRSGAGADIAAALVGTAGTLMASPVPGGLEAPAPAWGDGDLEDRATAWGPARAVPVPGHIDGIGTHLAVDPGPLGRHAPAFPAGDLE